MNLGITSKISFANMIEGYYIYSNVLIINRKSHNLKRIIISQIEILAFFFLFGQMIYNQVRNYLIPP